MTYAEFYASVGGNYEETLSRLVSERILKKFVLRYASDPTAENLKGFFEERNSFEAFRAAHTLKGIALNLGFVHLSSAASELTELLRSGENAFETMLDAYKRVLDAHNAVLLGIPSLPAETDAPTNRS